VRMSQLTLPLVVVALAVSAAGLVGSAYGTSDAALRFRPVPSG
jgi:hypothetical protein